jgi:hypothetical protein
LSYLHRKPDKDPQLPGGWFVYWGDVRIGHIGKRAGVPNHAPQWGWRCGFYPGCDPGQATMGSADSFEEARAGFEKDWLKLSATRTEAHFELWRQSRDFNAWKNRMHAERLPLPTQRTSGQSRCFCGEPLASGLSMEKHVYAAHRGIGDSQSGAS